MVHRILNPPATIKLLDDEPVVPGETCPMCHTRVPMAAGALAAGGSWRCARCGQHWDALRLAAVAGYAAWAERDRADTSATRIALRFPERSARPEDVTP